jgi:hypothetical protein
VIAEGAGSKWTTPPELHTARLAFGVDLQYEAPGGFIRGKTSSAISGHPDIPCFLLLDDPANELFLSVGLGADRILAPLGGSSNRVVGN